MPEDCPLGRLLTKEAEGCFERPRQVALDRGYHGPRSRVPRRGERPPERRHRASFTGVSEEPAPRLQYRAGGDGEASEHGRKARALLSRNRRLLEADGTRTKKQVR